MILLIISVYRIDDISGESVEEAVKVVLVLSCNTNKRTEEASRFSQYEEKDQGKLRAGASWLQFACERDQQDQA